MRKIRVLEVIDKTFLGGGQKNLLSLAENLDKERFDISVCSNPKGHLVDEALKKNIPHFPVSMSKRFSLKPVNDIEDLLKRNRFDIIHTHGGVAGFYGRWAAQKFPKLAVVHTLHGIHYLYYRNVFLKYFYIYIERIFSKFTDAVIFVSQADKKKASQFKLASREKIRLIQNGIDFSWFESRGQKKNKGDKHQKGPVVGTVARLHRQKNISLLIRAGLRVKKEVPGLRILVVGDGPLRSHLEKMNKKMGTDDTIYFLGERQDVADIMSVFDVFVLPSLWEGLPYVLLEAAALKKPVIGTDVDGIREIIKNKETGLLVSPHKPGELADAMMKLLNKRETAERYGAAFYRDMREKYSISRMVNKVQDLYRELFGRMERD